VTAADVYDHLAHDRSGLDGNHCPGNWLRALKAIVAGIVAGEHGPASPVASKSIAKFFGNMKVIQNAGVFRLQATATRRSRMPRPAHGVCR